MRFGKPAFRLARLKNLQFVTRVAPVTISPAASQFLARATTVTLQADKDRYTAFIDSLVAAGLWAKADLLHFFGIAPNSTEARKNLLSSNFAALPVGGPVFTAYKGFKGTAAGYLRSQFTPSLHAVKFTLTSGCVAAWNLATRTAGGNALFGAINATSVIALYPFYPTSYAVYGLNNSEGTEQLVVVPGSTGLWAIDRAPDGYLRIYRNGVLVGSPVSVAPTALVSLNVYMLAENRNGTAGAFGTDELAFFGIFSSLTASDHAALYAKTQTSLTSSGAI